MIKGKEAYLKKLTAASMQMRSVSVGRELEGSSPPSVFIGSWNYPKVYAGPLIAPAHGDTAILDTPEDWIPQEKTQEDIINYRLNLVRGKKTVSITDLDNQLIEKLQGISMADGSIESDAEFVKAPRGTSFSDDHTPYGPSAEIYKFDIENVRWDHQLEKVYYDTDLKAVDAVMMLHEKDLPFSNIQKAFSVGTMGMKRRRKLVPTRWSITACDSTIGNNLLEEVRHYDNIDTFRVHEFSSLNNHYAVMLMPTFWQYEWMEAFLHILGREEMIYSDYEYNPGKKGYSCVGGCYYSCKMAVLEALAREKKQAGAIILREAYTGYVPLGVFNVRENVRNAMKQPGAEFNDMKSALSYIGTKLRLPVSKFMAQGHLLKELMRCRQTTLNCF
jgi:hypothetical protein